LTVRSFVLAFLDATLNPATGDLGPAELEETSQPPGSESSRTLEGSSKPEPAPLFDHLREGQYAEAGAVPTGFFAAALLDKYEAQQLLASYRERAEAEVPQ
jgi:hypothetical protein